MITLPKCSRGCFFLRCGGLWDRALFVVWLVSVLTRDLVSQSGVMGMTDFEIDRQDILPLSILFQSGTAQECFALAYILIVRRQRELRVGIGARGSCSVLLNKRCSIWTETHTSKWGRDVLTLHVHAAECCAGSCFISAGFWCDLSHGGLPLGL